jgi:hypothetical protein
MAATDPSDAVTLHLWQAVQSVIDLAVSACARLKLGTPDTYADAFHRLAEAGRISRWPGPHVPGRAGNHITSAEAARNPGKAARATGRPGGARGAPGRQASATMTP